MLVTAITQLCKNHQRSNHQQAATAEQAAARTRTCPLVVIGFTTVSRSEARGTTRRLKHEGARVEAPAQRNWRGPDICIEAMPVCLCVPAL